MHEEVAISVQNVSKTFRIPHEKVTSLRSAAVGVFSRKRGYEEFKALDDVSFEVKKGEFFGIIGRNGSGKSTLLKILAGIYQADKGKVKINGRISPFLELGIGFNPELSGRDNIYLNATVLGLTKKQIDEKFNDIVEFSELERFIDQKLKNYSSGMQVRLAFSVSIHANREILLMDEVLAVGDNNFQSKCLTEFNKYKDMGRTVILVTHSIETVQRYCDRALLLRNGRIERIGKADEVGNEYIYQNMSDEEKRILDEVKLSEKYILSNRDESASQEFVKITDVKFLDKKGKQKNIFSSGEDIIFSVSFRYSNYDDSFGARISVESEDGHYLFGYDTFSDNFKIKRDKKEFSLRLPENPFLSGKFYVNVSLFDHNMKPLDFKPRADKFQIFSLASSSRCKGFLKLNHDWE
ncbi:MAG: ABC transporter ATP-binding protein [Candidatus Moranbacteria bacterium]|nr:ABC transporter ATP-binding protein [Candidatus Moranbacteria bacterium]